MLKKLMLSAFAFMFVQVQAEEKKDVWPEKSITLECLPATKAYPFDHFALFLNKKESTLRAKFSKQAGSIYEAIELKTDRNSNYLDVEEITVDEDGGELFSLDAKVYGDFYDWGAVRIEIGQDDDGYAAFVHFYSDGPAIRSFYRCEIK